MSVDYEPKWLTHIRFANFGSDRIQLYGMKVTPRYTKRVRSKLNSRLAGHETCDITIRPKPVWGKSLARRRPRSMVAQQGCDFISKCLQITLRRAIVKSKIEAAIYEASIAYAFDHKSLNLADEPLPLRVLWMLGAGYFHVGDGSISEPYFNVRFTVTLRYRMQIHILITCHR